MPYACQMILEVLLYCFVFVLLLAVHLVLDLDCSSNE